MSTKPPGEDAKPEENEGWEALSEEPTEGTIAPTAELEEALAEASQAVEALEGAARHPKPESSADKVMLEALSTELQALKGEYESKLEELTKVKDQQLRLQAEFENFRRRGMKERQEAHNFGHQNLVKDLLSTVDNLDRAIEHVEQSGTGDLQSLLQGVELVRRELLGALKKHGVCEVETAGGAFDPALHEAMAQVPNAEVAANSIVQVLQKGYQLHDRMLRPARVIVSRELTPEEAAKSGASDTEQSE